MTQKIELNTIESFQWDSSLPSSIEFFGETAIAPIEKKSLEDEEIEKDSGKNGKKENLEEDVTFFGEENLEEELDSKKDIEKEGKGTTETFKENTEEDSDINVSKSTLNFLKDRGLITLSEDEDVEDLDAEDIETLVADKFEQALDTRLEESMGNLPDTVKDIVRFAAKGGNVDEMLADISKPVSKGITSTLDLNLETNQEKIVKYQLEKDGYDSEYIESQIEYLKDSDKLESIAKKHFDKFLKEDAIKKASYVEKQKAFKEQQKAQQINFKKEVSQHLSETESINNLKFSTNDIKTLPEYIGNASIKLEDGREITPFYRDLFESMKDKDKLVVLAKLVKNNFDFSDIEKNIETGKTRELKEKLQRQKDSKIPKSAGGSSQPKRLADMFD